MSLPPSPRGPHLLQTAGWVTRPGPYSRRLRARFGDTFTLHVDRRAPWVVLSHPDDVRQVFTGDPNVFHAGEGNAILRPLLGARSVLLLDGPEHMRERKLLLPPFHGERMQALRRADARDRRRRRSLRWPTGEPLGVLPADAGADARDHHARGLRRPRATQLARCAAPARHARLTSDPLRARRWSMIGPARPLASSRAFAPLRRAGRRAV